MSAQLFFLYLYGIMCFGWLSYVDDRFHIICFVRLHTIIQICSSVVICSNYSKTNSLPSRQRFISYKILDNLDFVLNFIINDNSLILECSVPSNYRLVDKLTFPQDVCFSLSCPILTHGRTLWLET